MKVEQYVMAYSVEQDRLRAMLPEGFTSLRPVLRVNAEIRAEQGGYVELNTAVERDGVRGWLNIAVWEDVSFRRQEKTVTFRAGALEISFAGVGITGGCPAEKDNQGCFFLQDEDVTLREAEEIEERKEFCDCRFVWGVPGGAEGESTGETLPAIPQERMVDYPRRELTAENAAVIPCRQVLGAYRVCFERERR